MKVVIRSGTISTNVPQEVEERHFLQILNSKARKAGEQGDGKSGDKNLKVLSTTPTGATEEFDANVA